MKTSNPFNDYYKLKKSTDIPREIRDLTSQSKNPSHDLAIIGNAKNEFDPSEEAKKLVSAWKKIEREAESIKDKANNRKRPLSSQKHAQSKLPTKANFQTPKDPKNKKDLDAYIKENIGITGKNMASKDTMKASQRPSSRGGVNSAKKSTGLDTEKMDRLKDFENNLNDLRDKGESVMGINSRKSSHTQDSLGYSQSESASLQEFERNLVSRAHQAHAQELHKKENNSDPELLAFLERAKEATMLTFEEAKELYEKLKSEGGLEIDEDDMIRARMPLKEIELNSANINMNNIKPSIRERSRMNDAQKLKAQKPKGDEQKMREVLTTLQKNQQDAKNTLYNFKLQKFCAKLEPIFSNVTFRKKAAVFQRILDVADHERKQCEKVDLLKRLQLESTCFCMWVMFVREMKLERHHRKMETEKESEETQMKKAKAFYHHKLLRKYFNRGFTKLHVKAKQEKDVKISQNRMKAAIDKFLTKLQPQQINEKDSRAIDNYAKQLTENILAHPTESPSKHKRMQDNDEDQETSGRKQRREEYDIDRLIKLPDEYDKTTGKEDVSFEEVEQDYSNPQRASNKADRENQNGTPDKGSRFNNQSSSTVKNKPVTAEEKAKMRKANAELIKKKHDELRAKKEEEARELEKKEKEELQRRKVEERKAWERKRREEAEAVERKQREQEEYVEKKKMASQFHQQWLLRRYGMKAARIIVNLNRAKGNFADKHRASHIKELAFESWKEAIVVLRAEMDSILAPKIKMAEDINRSNLLKKCFNVLVQESHKRKDQDKYYDQYRERAITRKCFVQWCLILSQLKRENIGREERYDQQIKKFSSAKLLKKAFTGLKDNVNEEVKEKIKKNHRNVMWSKVNSWLTEYKATKVKEDSDDETW